MRKCGRCGQEFTDFCRECHTDLIEAEERYNAYLLRSREEWARFNRRTVQVIAPEGVRWVLIDL